MESQKHGIFVKKCYPQHIQSERFASKATSMNKYRKLGTTIQRTNYPEDESCSLETQNIAIY
jgi:hypothetical protein